MKFEAQKQIRKLIVPYSSVFTSFNVVINKVKPP